MRSGSEEGSHPKLVDFCITQLWAASNKKEEEEPPLAPRADAAALGVDLCKPVSVAISSNPPQTSFMRSCREREFFVDDLLVQIHFVIEMIWWTGLAPWEFELPGSLTSTLSPLAAERAQSPLQYNRTPKPYRGTSLLRQRTPLGPYSRPVPGVLGES